MRTVIEVIKSLPEPYRQEVLLHRNVYFDYFPCKGNIPDLLMDIMPASIIRDTIIKAYLRGDLNVRGEARPELVTPANDCFDCQWEEVFGDVVSGKRTDK